MAGGEDSGKAKIGELLGSFLGMGDGIESTMESAGEPLCGGDHGFISFEIKLVFGGDASKNESVDVGFGEYADIVKHGLEVAFGRAEIGFGLGDHHKDGDLNLGLESFK